MAKETSPEEKLLNLIKGKNKKAAGAPAVTKAPVMAPAAEPKEPDRMPAEAVVSKTDERISGILKSELFKNKFFEPAILKNINKYLVIVLGVLLLYFMTDLIFVRPYKNVQSLIVKASAPQAQNENKALAEPKNVTVVKDYSS